jgi:flagellar hook-length control protein FliK
MMKGDPTAGKAAPGNPTAANQTPGDPAATNRTSGNPIAGNLATANPAAGNPAVANPNQGPWPDLKGLFLRILQTIEQKGEQSVGTREFLDLIQGSQSLSLLAKEGETSLYLPLLLWGLQQGDWGDLRIHGEGGQQDEKQQKKHWSVLMRLDLKSFGRLIVKLVLSKNLLHCNIRASNKETQAMIEEGLSELRGRLRSLGLEGVQCECGPMKDDSEWENPDRDTLPAGLLTLSV